MRAWVLSLVLSAAVLFPIVGKAQVYPLRPSSPPATAASAEWQINGEPVVLQGIRYQPDTRVPDLRPAGHGPGRRE